MPEEYVHPTRRRVPANAKSSIYTDYRTGKLRQRKARGSEGCILKTACEICPRRAAQTAPSRLVLRRGALARVAKTCSITGGTSSAARALRRGVFLAATSAVLLPTMRYVRRRGALIDAKTIANVISHAVQGANNVNLVTPRSMCTRCRKPPACKAIRPFDSRRLYSSGTS